MKSFLRGILNFLDRKFPDKVVVTLADYSGLKEKISSLEKAIERVSDERVSELRIKNIEAELNKFNIALGFNGSAIPKGLASSFHR